MEGFKCMKNCYKDVLKGKTDKLDTCDFYSLFGDDDDDDAAKEDEEDDEAREANMTHPVPPPGMQHPFHMGPPPKKSMFTMPVLIGIGVGVCLLFVCILVLVMTLGRNRDGGSGSYYSNAGNTYYAGSGRARGGQFKYNNGAKLRESSLATQEKPDSGDKSSNILDATSHVPQRRNRPTNRSHTSRTTEKVKYRTGLASEGSTKVRTGLASEGTTKVRTGKASGKRTEKTKERMHKLSRKSKSSTGGKSAIPMSMC